MASQLYKILVIDGSEDQASRLKKLLESSSKGSSLDISVVTNGEGLRALFVKTPPFRFDIAFVGLQLQDGDEVFSGPETVRRYFSGSERPLVVYLAKRLQEISQAYDTKHVFMLPVPVDLADLEKALDKALCTIGVAHVGDSLVIRSGGDIVRLPVRSVAYVESIGHKMLLHGVDGKENTMYGSLRSLQETLPLCFSRAHKSYLVNMEYVSKLARTSITLSDGSVIPLSRNYRASFKDAYIRFFEERD